MSKLTLETLRELREKSRVVVELRDSDNKTVQVVVGMGTSGLEHGAKKIFNTLADLVAEKALVEVLVRQSDAMGYPEQEPTVEVVVPGMEPTLYGKVDESVARDIIEKHVIGKQVLTDHVVTK